MELTYQVEALLVLGSTALLTFLVKWLSATQSNLPYPPGPKGYPLIGCLFEMPLDRSWLGYDKWLKEYGRCLLRTNRCDLELTTTTI